MRMGLTGKYPHVATAQALDKQKDIVSHMLLTLCLHTRSPVHL